MALRENLSKFIAELDDVIDTGVERSANYIADVARQLVPVDTGALKSSIEVEGDQPMQRTVVAGGDSAPYGIYQEYGTYKMVAQPFMGPAAKQVKPATEIAKEVQSLERRCSV